MGESRERDPPHRRCVPQQIPAFPVAWSVAVLAEGGRNAGTIWSVLLPSLAGGGLGEVAGAAGRA